MSIKNSFFSFKGNIYIEKCTVYCLWSTSRKDRLESDGQRLHIGMIKNGWIVSFF